MFCLRTRSARSRKPVTARSVTPFLESLEDRICPTFGPPAEVLTLAVTYDPNQQVTLTGQLTKAGNPIGNETINFGGAVNGSVTTDSQGGYNITLTALQLGQLTAASADGRSSASATLVNGTPAISDFNATCEDGNTWEFTGSVSGAPMQGEVVNLGGIPALNNVQVNVNPDGTFCVLANVSSGNGGIATAQAVDWWGDTSDVAETSVPV